MRLTQEDRDDALALPISAIREGDQQLQNYFESLTLAELAVWVRAVGDFQADISTIYHRKVTTEMTKGKK